MLTSEIRQREFFLRMIFAPSLTVAFFSMMAPNISLL